MANIKGWAVRELRKGSVMDDGTTLSLELLGEDGQSRNVFLPTHEANHAIKLMLSLAQRAQERREELGTQRQHAGEEMQHQQYKVKKADVGADESGNVFAIRFETFDAVSWVYALDQAGMKSLAETLVATLSKFGVRIDATRRAR
jgi:hypothetical protein